MAWEVLAQGSFEEFQAYEPQINLPKGTKMRLEIDTSPWPVAPLANLWGAEWVAQKLLDDSGAEVKDVYGQGWTKVIVDMEADPVWVPFVIIAIASILVIAGLAYLIKEIRLLAEKVTPVVLGTTVVIVAGIAALGFLAYAISRRV